MKISLSRFVPHGTLFFALSILATHVHAQDALPPDTAGQGEVQAESSAPVPAFFLLSMATESTEASDTTQLGIRDMLLGWDEMARLYFRTAVKADRNCALAWCGLMLTEEPTAESRNELERIFAADCPATPPEMNLLTTLLRLVRGEHVGAGEEFAERATQFRADTLSACWAAYLLRDGYEEIVGKPLPNQQRSLEMIESQYTRKPQDPMVAYLRGWVEESAPEPSDAALAAAQYAAETLREHPAPQLLYGHLLFRKGRLDEALAAVRRASQYAEEQRKNVPHGTMEQAPTEPYPLEMWPLEIRSRLYESTILFLKGDVAASRKLQSELAAKAHAVSASLAAAPGAILLQWEARTLPLRLLVLAPKKPADAQVSAAVKLACPSTADKQDPVFHACECLRFCLVARQRAGGKRQAQAIRCLESAEASLSKVAAAKDACRVQGAYALSAWSRMHEACRLAILAAKSAVYSKTESIWTQSLNEGLKRPATLLMPPVLPGKGR